MNQKSLAGLERAALEDIMPHRHERLGQASRFGHAKPGRHPHARSLKRQRIFGIAPASGQRRHLVARLPARDALAKRGNLAPGLKPRDVRHSRRRRIKPLALQHVGPVNTRRRNLNENLAAAGAGHWHLGNGEHIGAAGFADDDRFHAFSSG